MEGVIAANGLNHHLHLHHHTQWTALTIMNSSLYSQLLWGAEHQEIKGTLPNHFSLTGKEEEVGWLRETSNGVWLRETILLSGMAFLDRSSAADCSCQLPGGRFWSRCSVSRRAILYIRLPGWCEVTWVGWSYLG